MPSDESESDDEPEEKVHLEWKDYVAFVIAAFETVLLPMVVFALVLLLLLVIIR